MDLRVEEKAWNAIVALAEKGGWEDLDLKPKKGSANTRKAAPGKAKGKVVVRKPAEQEDVDEDSGADYGSDEPKPKGGKKRKLEEDDDSSTAPRRSSRRKR
ncbi:hypothetical protein H0H81_010966 [Sphagnurus paluster]|uniref:Uncharacterized protein n=1 Tax=Sphagnurus paluster TaxID=117069 RepID=A0A9P7FSM7_9AGAR|nr:hypothetical protein H0H81_010966 [Sphagnurus paluster]